MRQVIILLFLCNYFISSGQEPEDSYRVNHFEYGYVKPVKTKIFLIKGNTFRASVTKITDRMVIYIATGTDEKRTGLDSISVNIIDKIKIKRNAVENGMIAGGGIGYIAGSGVGYISYNYDWNESDQSNKDSRESRAFFGGFIGAVPGTFIGGMIGGIFTKRVFKINGKPENLSKLVNLLNRKVSIN